MLATLVLSVHNPQYVGSFLSENFYAHHLNGTHGKTEYFFDHT